MRQLLRTRYGGAGLAIMLLLVLVALLAPSLVPYGPRQQVATSLLPPSLAFPMGTDNIGRDVFSLVLIGTRASLAIGIAASCAALLVGAAVGMAAATGAGWPKAC